MARIEKEVRQVERSSWVVVDEFELNASKKMWERLPHAALEIFSDDKLPQAYDPHHDVRRYTDLVGEYGEKKAKEYLSIELESDIQTHFAELGGEDTRTKYFEYGYVIGDDGGLREEKGAKSLISEWFTGQEHEVLGDLWLSHIIPFLEDASVGQSAFTLSVRADSIHEGAYDFGYFFIKISEEEIACFGVELDLSREEQGIIINMQLEVAKAPRNVFLDHDFNWNKARGRAVFYEGDRFSSFDQMFLEIIGKPVSKFRGDFFLEDEDSLREFIFDQKQKNISYEDEAAKLSEEMVDVIVGDKYGDLNEIVMVAQLQRLMSVDPELVKNSMDRGYVVLACGIVSLGGFDEGSGLNLSEEKFGGFDCPKCSMFIKSGSGDECPHCGYTKQEHARKTGINCE